MQRRPETRPHRGRRRSIAGVASLCVAVTLAALGSVVGVPETWGWVWRTGLGTLIVAAGAWAVWQARADRLAHEQAIAVRAAEDASRDVRLELARDLHDIVSHGLAAITMQAAVGRRLAADRPQVAVDSLAGIEDASRRATADLTVMMQALRWGPPDGPVRSVPGLAAVAEEVEQARDHGLTVTASGLDTPAADAAGAVAHSVIHEALTNVRRHVGPTRVEVSVRRDADRLALIVEVTDHGRAGPWDATPGSGHGLTALRERVAAVNGRFEAGPAEGGGFRVLAVLPDVQASPGADAGPGTDDGSGSDQ